MASGTVTPKAGRDVAGALPFLLQDKRRRPVAVQRQQRGRFRLPAPTDDQGLQQGMRLLAGIQEGAVLGAV